jgi:hypothetical protein
MAFGYKRGTFPKDVRMKSMGEGVQGHDDATNAGFHGSFTPPIPCKKFPWPSWMMTRESA